MGALTSPSSAAITPRVTLGIDPGTAIVGYAVVAAQGSELSMVTCDVITTPAGMPLPERLQHIYLLRQKCTHGIISGAGAWSSDAGIGKWGSYSR